MKKNNIPRIILSSLLVMTPVALYLINKQTRGSFFIYWIILALIYAIITSIFPNLFTHISQWVKHLGHLLITPRFWGNVGLAILACIVTIAALEGITRILMQPVPFVENLLGELPLENVSTSEPFLNAYMEGKNRIDKATWDAELNLWIPENYQGTYINVEANRRFTTGQPAHYENTIYVFGGSTIYSLEVADAFTIPSLLQQKINTVAPDKYRVINMGVMAYSIEHQTTLLKSIDLQPGDKVIFYDGVNDGSFLYFCCIQHYGKTLSDLENDDRTTPAWQEFVHNLDLYLTEHSVFYHNFISYRNHPPANTRDKASYEQLKQQLYERTIRQISEANQYAEKEGAMFYHFLQPSAINGSQKSEREALFSSQYRFFQYGVAEMFLEGYDILKSALHVLAAQGIHNHDLTLILDETPRKEDVEYFYDWCHVNHLANEIIAEAIFEEILPALTP